MKPCCTARQSSRGPSPHLPVVAKIIVQSPSRRAVDVPTPHTPRTSCCAPSVFQSLRTTHLRHNCPHCNAVYRLSALVRSSLSLAWISMGGGWIRMWPLPGRWCLLLGAPHTSLSYISLLAHIKWREFLTPIPHYTHPTKIPAGCAGDHLFPTTTTYHHHSAYDPWYRL